MPVLENPEQYKKAPAKALLKKALEMYQHEQERCQLSGDTAVAAAALEELPVFEKTEIGLGRVVGRGGFCIVRDIQSIKLSPPAGGGASAVTSSTNGSGGRWMHRSRTPSNTSTSNETAESVLSEQREEKEQQQQQQQEQQLTEQAPQQADAVDANATSTTAATSSTPEAAPTSGESPATSDDANNETPQPQVEQTEEAAATPATAEVTQTIGPIVPPQRPPPPKPTVSSVSSTINSREYLARRVWSKHRYVVKQVNRDLLQIDRVAYLKATTDLALEASILARLQHSNVVQLKAVSAAAPCTAGFFLIMEKLRETLPKRLNTWMQTKRATTGITGFFVGNKQKVCNLMIDRLLVAHDIAEAMEYVHSRQLIFRDLKPDNVGFDSENAVKLFDFGLTKQLLEKDRGPDGLYQLTGMTGSIRYMAPEVGLQQPYNQAADVYSWSMIMWFVLALEPPLCTYTPNMFHSRVFEQGYRPAVKQKWPARLCDLLKACWAQDWEDRPSFHRVVQVIRSEATRLEPQLADFLAGEASSSKWSQKQEKSGWRRQNVH